MYPPVQSTQGGHGLIPFSFGKFLPVKIPLHLMIWLLVYSFTTQSRLLTTLKKKPFENIGKGENAGNQHFLLFPQCFVPLPKQISTLFCCLQVLSNWGSLKLCCLVKSSQMDFMNPYSIVK